jgi:uncharacterized protein YndB with AHSA1/START domain
MKTPIAESSSDPKSPRMVRVYDNVKAPKSDVWQAWTTSAGAETFFAPKANIQLAIGGPYEIYFDPTDEKKGTKGLKTLSYAPEEMISFQWNAPPDMPVVREGGTWLVVQFQAVGADKTHVTVTHWGWKDGREWDVAFPHMVRGWGDLIERLKFRFANGPIDWAREIDTNPDGHFSLKNRPHTDS